MPHLNLFIVVSIVFFISSVVFFPYETFGVVRWIDSAFEQIGHQIRSCFSRIISRFTVKEPKKESLSLLQQRPPWTTPSFHLENGEKSIFLAIEGKATPEYIKSRRERGLETPPDERDSRMIELPPLPSRSDLKGRRFPSPRDN
jgi:hypothetical protein